MKDIDNSLFIIYIYAAIITDSALRGANAATFGVSICMMYRLSDWVGTVNCSYIVWLQCQNEAFEALVRVCSQRPLLLCGWGGSFWAV
jgi:hypothetical protein